MTLQDEGTQEDALRGRDGAIATAEPPRARRLIGRRAGDREPRSSKSWILAVCCVAQFMVILDLSIVNVALPSIQSDLGFSSADLQWVVDGYAIAFAGFLMLGGRAADHFGQRRTFVLALLLFALASLIGGLAPTQEVLVGARIAQGVAGALMAASSLAIITSSFAPGPELHRAIGIWAAMNGLGGAGGVLFGGIITEALSWRWVLLINPPIGIAAALVAFRVVKDVRREDSPPFDIAGALTLTIGQMILVYGVVQAGLRGWHAPLALGPILVGLALLVAFGLIENRFAQAPLIPFKELTKPLKNANTIVLLFSAALFPMWYLSSLYLQQVLGLSPLNAGLIFLPMTIVIGVVARFAGKLVSRYGVRAVLGGGLTMMTAGMLLLTKIAASGSGVVYIMIPGMLTAAGIALSIVPSTIAATQGAKQGQAGLASGLVNTSRQVGGGLGLAVLITLATTYTSHLIGSGHGVPQSLTDGFRLGYYIGAGLCAVAALLTFALVPKTETKESSLLKRAPIALAVMGVVALFIAVDFAVGGSHGAPIGAYTTNGAYSYVSEPGLHPPKLRPTIATATNKLAPGYIFMANFYDLNYPPMVGQSGPLILDNNLQPVWFKPVPTSVVAGNLSLQSYHGKPVLAWWQGFVTNTGATEKGEYVIADNHYRTIATIHAANGWVLTIHEIVIRGDHAWVTANKNIPEDLSKYGGAYNGALIDSAVQEYNIKTGKLEYSWDAREHIPLSDSQASLPTNGFPWDAYHVNSIQVPGDGTFITSMRDTWAAYKVNIATGKTVWVLGGRHSTFKFGNGAEFEWQHHVSVYPGSPLVTVFDDHCCQITGGGTYVPPTGPSRGLVLKLDPKTHTASLADQYAHGSNFNAEYMGSIQPLANGNEFVGWGSAAYMSEFNVQGQILMDAVLPHPDVSYRASREPWVGVPLDPPHAAARQQGGRTIVYASWNGSTALASWRVLGGSGAGNLAPIGTSAKSGFETAIPVTQGATTFKVQALDRSGRVIGESAQFGLSH
jgi:EmrB/QacA subfamily drug resistance transporter